MGFSPQIFSPYYACHHYACHREQICHPEQVCHPEQICHPERSVGPWFLPVASPTHVGTAASAVQRAQRALEPEDRQ